MNSTMARSLMHLIEPINREVKFLNHGGCGIFAELFAKMLIELGFENISIVGVETTSYIASKVKGKHKRNVSNIREARECNLTKIDNDDYIEIYNHYMVKCGMYYFDSEGKNRIYKGKIAGKEDGWPITYYPIGQMGLEELEYLNYNVTGWNHTFKRFQIPVIKSFITDVKMKVSTNFAA